MMTRVRGVYRVRSSVARSSTFCLKCRDESAVGAVAVELVV